MKSHKLSEPTPIDSPTTKVSLTLNFKNKYPVNKEPNIRPIILNLPKYSADPKIPIYVSLKSTSSFI